jgi:hypothetical protein
VSRRMLCQLRLSALALAVLIAGAVPAHAQGCVAAHSNQQSMDSLCGPGFDSTGHGWMHRLTLNIGYRVFSSNKYFIGTNQIDRSSAVENHQNIWDVGVNYQATPRWSVIADVPIFDGSRDQIYPPKGIFRVAGIGDITVGAQTWVFRPPTESNGNVAFNFSLKLPTGLNDATGPALLNGQIVQATADQSLQPGDGTWGFVLGTQAFRQVWWQTMLYLQGSWLFSPEDTTGVATFRHQPGQGVMSATDQYLFRAGVSHGVPKIRRLSLSFGARWEGVPAHDVFGESDGFRRPGYIVSIDPGLMYDYHHEMISVNAPWAIRRNREPSVPEIENNTPNGDAFFADYTIIVGYSHHF